MRRTTDSQWQRFFELQTRLRTHSPAERAAALQALRAQEQEDPHVVSLLEWHYAMPPDPDRDRTGERISDKFTLCDRLGAGGMGVVYRAQQHFMEDATRDVALKLIHPALLSPVTDHVIEKFKAEIRMLASLQYEGIARIYDGGLYEEPTLQQPFPYMAMELVRNGQPITDYATAHALDARARLALFVRVCHAVRYAHEHRIIHRDLKPTNILIDSDGKPVIIDFGLAHVCDALLPGAHLAASGTPAYMSPEQISEAFGEVSDKSDTYALGLVLYELLTGQLPYRIAPESSFETLCQVITQAEPPPLRQYSETYDPTLEEIVTLALAKVPAQRLTVTVLRSRIERYLTTLQPEPPPGEPWQGRHKGRRRRVTGTWLGALGLVLVLAGLWWWMSQPPPALVDVHVLKHSLGSVSPLKRGEELTAQDRYEIAFTPQHTAYVYVYQIDGKGDVTLLFPNPDWTTAVNPVPAGTAIRIPHDREKAIGLRGPPGREVIIVGASSQSVRAPMQVPRHQLDSILGRMEYRYHLEFQNNVSSPDS